MELTAENFTNNNPNFSNVKFEIKDGGLTINASAEEVVVTITENSAEYTYDGTEKSVTGYTVTEISNELYKDCLLYTSIWHTWRAGLPLKKDC